MQNNLVYLEQAKKILKLQRKYEQGLINEDTMSVEEMNSLHNLYLNQIKELQKDLKLKLSKSKGGES